MNKTILISGLVMLIINGVGFLIFDSFDSDSFIASEISIGLSLFLLYGVSNSSIDDAFKISLTLGLIFSALIKYVISLFFSIPLTNNYVFFALLILSGIEVLGFVGLRYFTKYS